MTGHCVAQMLDAMDSKRVEGVFCGDLSHVPEGQARAMQLLDDSYGARSVHKVVKPCISLCRVLVM